MRTGGVAGSASAHDTPEKHGEHRHLPPSHRPLPWQPEAQASARQSKPEAPGWQKQTPATQAPRLGPPQSLGHVGCSHVGGAKPGLQVHVPSPLQTPLPWQPWVHAGRSHSGPSQPRSHSHRPLSAPQRPWPEHPLGQPRARPHCLPENPGSQKHVPLRQAPWAPQPPSHARSSHVLPLQPLAHSHWPESALQRPRANPPQPAGHVRSEQSGPSKPAEHEHLPRTHTPRP